MDFRALDAMFDLACEPSAEIGDREARGLALSVGDQEVLTGSMRAATQATFGEENGNVNLKTESTAMLQDFTLSASHFWTSSAPAAKGKNACATQPRASTTFNSLSWHHCPQADHCTQADQCTSHANGADSSAAPEQHAEPETLSNVEVAGIHMPHLAKAMTALVRIVMYAA